MTKSSKTHKAEKQEPKTENQICKDKELREFLSKNIVESDMDDFLAFLDEISEGDGRVSDSVIEDWGNEHPKSNPWRAIDRLTAKNTSCEGCQHVGFRYDWAPCATCVRNPSVRATDNYKPEK